MIVHAFMSQNVLFTSHLDVIFLKGLQKESCSFSEEQNTEQQFSQTARDKDAAKQHANKKSRYQKSEVKEEKYVEFSSGAASCFSVGCTVIPITSWSNK